MMLVMVFTLSQAEDYIKEISHFPKSRLVAGGSCLTSSQWSLPLSPEWGGCMAALAGDIWIVVKGDYGPGSLLTSSPSATHQLPGL